ncbi:ATP-binding protein [Mangrovactinospora gilvigrisea]|uniref:ATP-binding protein n=1 Tax=Mangrovactinospora gilvigrisea TaxID=1428644 RepID=A0A1J7BBH8_9ACTN|nr:ATP-binding protein [Mangrovactinospora gilvigrisea]OIV35957.1 ATP-binding protein [Mangrovactinospora gilvigrisea]
MRIRAAATPLFTPRTVKRAQARERRKALAQTRRQARSAAEEARRAQHPVPGDDDALLGTGPVYPSGGRPGPAAARGGKVKLPAHRVTTAVAAGAYPFLAEGGLGAQGLLIGQDVHAEAAFCFDPFELYGRLAGFTNPNLLLAGVIGMGKSALAKSIALRATCFGYRVYVPCDPKGEWSNVTLQLGGSVIALGPGLPGRLNPLDAPPRPPGVSAAAWAGEVRKRRLLLLSSLTRTVLGRPLTPMEHTALDVALDAAVNWAAGQNTVPLLPHVARILNHPDVLTKISGEVAGRLGDAVFDVAHALRRLVSGDLAGMFDAPSTTAFDPRVPVLSIDLSRLNGTGDDTALVLAMTCASAWMEAALSDPGGGRRFVIYDEAWRVMRHQGLLERMQAQWKLSRGLGIANLLVIHRLSDLLSAGDAGSRSRALAEGLLSDCSTRIIYRQEHDQLAATGALLGLTGVEMRAVADLPRGRGLWKIADRSFVAHHQLHPAELAMFDTDARLAEN